MMKRIMMTPFLVLLILVFSVPALATGNGAPSGTHYNLNIIGVDKGKTADMTGSDRHTIFVALGSNKAGTIASRSNIYLTPGDFTVCDGNATPLDSAAIDCAGDTIASQGAVFQLPCNTAVPTDISCGDGDASASYSVWARALGTPGGHAVITTCALDDLGNVICSTDNSVTLDRTNPGKQTFMDATKELTTLNWCTTVDGAIVCQRIPLFSGGLSDFYWQYDNNGLRLAQLRFYLNQ